MNAENILKNKNKKNKKNETLKNIFVNVEKKISDNF